MRSRASLTSTPPVAHPGEACRRSTRHATRSSERDRRLGGARVERHDHAEPAVEHPHHLVGADRPATLDLEEDLGRRERVHVDHRVEVVGQESSNVADDATAGDVGRSVQARTELLAQREDERCVDHRRHQQLVAERARRPGYAGCSSDEGSLTRTSRASV